MKINHFDPKSGEMKITLETLDDLWHLEQVLEIEDQVEAQSYRTFKIGNKEEKKPVKIRVKAEKIEYSKNANRLRILGVIVWGEPEEFVQLGKYHTIDVGVDDKIKIVKHWKKHQVNRLQEAIEETKKPKLRVILIDDEKALTAILRAYGVEWGAEFYSQASKKDEKYADRQREFFGKIAAEIARHEEKYVIAGPGFTKDNLKEFIASKNSSLLKRIAFENVSYAEKNGMTELFNRGLIEKIIGEERLAKEMKLFEEFIINVNKDNGYSVYGVKEAEEAVNRFAVKTLLVLDSYLREDKKVQELLEKADRNKAEIVVFSSDGEAGDKLKGMGKIAAILKFKIRD